MKKWAIGIAKKDMEVVAVAEEKEEILEIAQGYTNNAQMPWHSSFLLISMKKINRPTIVSNSTKLSTELQTKGQ